ncbi:hypothetical protein DPEC_G00308770 [Dallia pectoralis]|uniref:Uncharacterized protein n=1 Tax=Dallia pectoralis TaxID=75939 RepID=A0ACC2FER9_DALPE|nr:hypothetical protein DPEC_G00308770 [Dallia pectoralis]
MFQNITVWGLERYGASPPLTFPTESQPAHRTEVIWRQAPERSGVLSSALGHCQKQWRCVVVVGLREKTVASTRLTRGLADPTLWCHTVLPASLTEKLKLVTNLGAVAAIIYPEISREVV